MVGSTIDQACMRFHLIRVGCVPASPAAALAAAAAVTALVAGNFVIGRDIRGLASVRKWTDFDQGFHWGYMEIRCAGA